MWFPAKFESYEMSVNLCFGGWFLQAFAGCVLDIIMDMVLLVSALGSI